MLAEFGGGLGLTCDEGVPDARYEDFLELLKSFGIDDSYKIRIEDTISHLFLWQTWSAPSDIQNYEDSSVEYQSNVNEQEDKVILDILELLGVSDTVIERYLSCPRRERCLPVFGHSPR